jgi:DnaJ-class molecular chaperone
MSWEAWETPEYLDQPECETCEGSGKSIDDEGETVPCPDCRGIGYQEPPERLEDDVI